MYMEPSERLDICHRQWLHIYTYIYFRRSLFIYLWMLSRRSQCLERYEEAQNSDVHTRTHPSGINTSLPTCYIYVFACVFLCELLWYPPSPTVPRTPLSFSVTYTTNNAQLAPNRHICETQLQLLITGPSIISHNQNHNRIKDESDYWAFNLHKVNSEYALYIYVTLH